MGGVEGVGKQLPWHSPQREAKSPGAYCAKADSGVPASVDQGDSNRCHCSRWPSWMSMLGIWSQWFLPREVAPLTSFLASFIYSSFVHSAHSSYASPGLERVLSNCAPCREYRNDQPSLCPLLWKRTV